MRLRILTAALAGAALFPASAAAALEEPATKAATQVGPVSALLHGELNPHAPGTAGYHFTWGQGASCEGNETEGQAEQTGEGIPVAQLINGLIPKEKYAFCVVATHQEGATLESLPGPVQTFETEAIPPVVEGGDESASALTPFAATLEARVNPENQPTTSCKIQWGKTTVSEHEVTCEPEVLEGFGEQAVSHRIEGLEPGTTYQFRVVVANATGTETAPRKAFTTSALEAPLIDGESVSAITSDNATLAAQVNPNYQEATYVFEYATNEAMTGATTVKPPAGTEPFPAGFEDHAASVDLPEALAPGTTYFYRVAAMNGTGTTRGPVQSFTTVGAPHVPATGAAAQITRTSVLMQGGSIDSDGAATAWYYRYLDQAGYEAGLAADPQDPYAHGAILVPAGSLPAAHETQAIASTPLTELRPGTTYHVALIALNSAGTSIGPDATFTTSAATPPLALTGAAEGVSQLSATITGTVEPRELPTQAIFQFGISPAALSPIPVALHAGSSVPVSVAFAADLAPGTTYYYRLVATNPDGTSEGALQSFTTPGLSTAIEAPLSRPLLPYTSIAALEAKEPKELPVSAPAHHGNPKKLKAALKKCRKKHGKARKSCERQARKRYG
jgi:hypothetical protein